MKKILVKHLFHQNDYIQHVLSLIYGFYFSKIFEASHSCGGIVIFYKEYIKHDIRRVMYMMKKMKINVIPCVRS